MSKDTISRQAAIEVAMEELESGTYFDIPSKIKGLPSVQPEILACGEGELNVPDTNVGDTISRQAALSALASIAGVGNRALDKIRALPSAQPERTCVNCGRTVNNGGWYADGKTRCPIEEHYALPKDGYCHLWEKRNVTDDDYPERREDEPTIEEQQWIPCSERLPDMDRAYYLVSLSDKKEVDIAYFTEYGTWETFRNDEVEAWMPLPEPYAERRTDERQEHTMEEFMYGQDMGNPEDGSL